MNTLIPIIGIFSCLVLILVPSAGAAGGSEGWIRIDCNVDGASVSFDGTYQGTISGGSLTVPVDAGFPFHSFSVEKSGYSTASGPVSMPSAGETTRVSAILTPVPAGTVDPMDTGSVAVASSPEGAQIFIDGRYRGQTPLTISDLSPGSYPISVELSGYHTYTSTITVYAGSYSSVFADLSGPTTTGSLYIISDPAGSSIYLDSLYLGTTPASLKGLTSGTHVLQLDHYGYYDWTSTVTVPNGRTATVSGTLSPLPAGTTGSIYVSSSPGGASVTIDGNPAGQTPSTGSLKLGSIPPGEHTLSLTLGGYQTQTVSSTAQINTVSEVSVHLDPVAPAPGNGELVISSTPPGANVFLDNIFTGVTPLTLASVPAGEHLVSVRLDGYQEYLSAAQVDTGASTTVAARLIPGTPAPTRSALPGVITALALVAGCVLAARRLS